MSDYRSYGGHILPIVPHKNSLGWNEQVIFLNTSGTYYYFDGNDSPTIFRKGYVTIGNKEDIYRCGGSWDLYKLQNDEWVIERSGDETYFTLNTSEYTAIWVSGYDIESLLLEYRDGEYYREEYLYLAATNPGPAVLYGWYDGGENDNPSGLTVNLVKGWSVAGEWKCIVYGANESLTFEWYKDGVLVSTKNGGTSSDCKPSSDEIGEFKYYCVVTFSSGESFTTDIMTVIVKAEDPDDPDPDNPDPDNPDPEETVSVEELKVSFWRGFAVSTALYSNGSNTKATRALEPVSRSASITNVARQIIATFWRGFAVGIACIRSRKIATEYLYGHAAGSDETPVIYIDGVGYVGVMLPALPEWDKEKYPYATIDLRADGTRLETSNKPWIPFGDGKFTKQASTASPLKTAYYYLIDGVWEFNREIEIIVHGRGMSLDSVAWANYDIVNEDGSIYLSATDPILVYE